MANTKKQKTTKRPKSSKPEPVASGPEEKKISFVFAIADREVKWSIKPSKKCKAVTVGGETDPERAPYYLQQIVKDAVEKLFPQTDTRPEHEKTWDQLYLNLIPWRKKGYENFTLIQQDSEKGPGRMVVVKFTKLEKHIVKEKGMPFYFDDKGSADNFEAYARPLIEKINSKEWNR